MRAIVRFAVMFVAATSAFAVVTAGIDWWLWLWLVVGLAGSWRWASVSRPLPTP
jgi:hypothetical protein